MTEHGSSRMTRDAMKVSVLACTRPACAGTDCRAGLLTAMEVACLFAIVHDGLDVDEEHMFREGGAMEASRIRLSAEGLARLHAESLRAQSNESLDPYGWCMLINALLDAELPQLVDRMWAPETPWVVEHALARVVDRIPCIFSAARLGDLVADCSTGPAEHLANTFCEHLMAALPRT
jgi:hypothetical protein